MGFYVLCVWPVSIMAVTVLCTRIVFALPCAHLESSLRSNKGARRHTPTHVMRSVLLRLRLATLRLTSDTHADRSAQITSLDVHPDKKKCLAYVFSYCSSCAGRVSVVLRCIFVEIVRNSGNKQHIFAQSNFNH